MCCNKKTVHLILGITFCTFGASSVFAEYEPNYDYSSLVLSYRNTKFADPVCIGFIDIECHTGLSGPAIDFTRQIIPNLALGVAGSYLQSIGNISSIKATNGAAYAQAIAGLGRRVDIGVSVAALISNTELCSAEAGICSTSNDTGTDLGVFTKVFLNYARTVSVGLSYNSVFFQKSGNQSIVGLSLDTILARHHRLAFASYRTLDTSGHLISGGYGFGYSYLVY